jgi:hypothetical protein
MVTVSNERIILGKTDHEFESKTLLISKTNNEGDNIQLYGQNIMKEDILTIHYMQFDCIMKVAKLWKWPFMVSEIEYKSNV